MLDSALEESFSDALGGAPEYPHYTRPAEYRGWRVPDVLLSGHHARIREWRLEQSAARGPLPWSPPAERVARTVRYHSRRPRTCALSAVDYARMPSTAGRGRALHRQ